MKKRLIFLISFILISISACGNNATSNSNQTTHIESTEQNVDDLQETNTYTGTSSVNEKIQDSEVEASNETDSSLDSYLTNPDDAIYFVPETDDWLITVETRDDYDPAETHISLYSFDASGMLVQYIDRRTNSDGSEVRTLPSKPNDAKSSDNKALYADRNNEYYAQYCHVSDKIYTYYELRNHNFVDVFYSPGLLESDTEIENPDDAVYKDICKVGELSGSDFFIYNLRTEAYADGYFSAGDDEVKEYDAFSLYTADVDCFNEKGEVIARYDVILLDDEDHIDDYWIRICSYDYDYYRETGIVRIDQSNYERASKNFVTMGNTIYFELSIDGMSQYNKAEYMTSFDGYFSQPYLTDSQIRGCTLME